MNIAIVGSKNVKKLADVLYQSFDVINVVGYDDVGKFRQAMVSRPLEFHRMILLEAAVSSEEVSTDDIYDFQEMVFKNYPAMKIVTISTNAEYTKFLASLFSGSNYGHFCFPSLKGKILVDLVSKDIPELYKRYNSYAYKEVVESKEEILEENKIITETYVENKSDIEGYIAPPENTKKRKGLGGLFGFTGPKQAGNLTMNSGLEHIGQGTGITEFSEGVQGIDFSGNNQGNNQGDQIFDDNMDYSNFPEEQSNEDERFDFFGGYGDGVDLGLGGIEDNQDMVDGVEETPDTTFVPYRMPQEEEPVPFDIHRLEKEEYVPLLDLEEKEEVEQQEVADINVPFIGLDSLKKTVEETDFSLSEDLFNQPNLIEKIGLDVEDADVGAFEGDMSALMSAYDDINSKPKEVIVERVRVVERGGSLSFRNKNGIKMIIVTGDRRIGSTKLALNLANKYAANEKVLFVDFDRNRHGSLGYIDLDGLLEEPEHIQNGFNHLKNLNILKNVCHYYKKGRFFTLTSMYGCDVEDNQMRIVQDVIASQKDYTTVVMDCPLEDLHLMQNIIPFARVLMCVEDDKVGIINLLTMLNSTFESENLLFNFFEKSHFVVGRKGNVQKFKNELVNVIDLFDLNEGMCRWDNIEVISNIKDIHVLLERTGD